MKKYFCDKMLMTPFVQNTIKTRIMNKRKTGCQILWHETHIVNKLEYNSIILRQLKLDAAKFTHYKIYLKNYFGSHDPKVSSPADLFFVS